MNPRQNQPPAWLPERIEPWPSRQHRTLAQVARTDELLAKAASRLVKFTPAETNELGHLLKKAYRFNPPPADPEAA